MQGVFALCRMNELRRAISGPLAKRMVLFLGKKLDDESWKIKQSFRQPSDSVSESFRFNSSKFHKATSHMEVFYYIISDLRRLNHMTEQERRRAFQKVESMSNEKFWHWMKFHTLPSLRQGSTALRGSYGMAIVLQFESAGLDRERIIIGQQ